MLLVTIICSDPECTEEREITVESLDDLEGYPCECGHGFVVASVSELDETKPGLVIPLPDRGRSSARRAA